MQHHKIINLLLLQCMLTNAYYTEFPPLKVIQHSLLGSDIQNFSRYSSHNECPLWFNYSSATNKCNCHFTPITNCDDGKACVNSDQILTYNSRQELLSSMTIRHRYLGGYNTTKHGYVALPSDISELNPYMCGPLNRISYMCSDCKSGYGPPAFFTSCTNVCHLCRDTWYDVALYLSLEFVPITLFYLVVLIFQIKLTLAPMTCFIMYCQLMVMAFYEECTSKSSPTLFSRVKYTDEGEIRTETKILLSLFGVFNLDFFHYAVSPFCVSSKLKPIHVVFLGYISVFYPFLLIILTWFCIELHGRNFKPLVYLWKPFHRYIVALRKSWNSKSDLIDVFASFLLLSYTKIIYQVVLTMNSSEIMNYSLVNGRQFVSYVLSCDTRIATKLKNVDYALITVVSVFLSFTLVIFPALLLILHPTRIFQVLSTKCLSNRFRITLTLFAEKFHSCYSDGLDGKRSKRGLSGLYFLLRIVACFTELINRNTIDVYTWFARGLLFSVATLLIALSRPYKKTYMNIMDSVLLFHMASVSYIASSCHESRISKWQCLHVAFALPFIVFCLIILYRIVKGVCKTLHQWLSLRLGRQTLNNGVTTGPRACDGLVSVNVDDHKQVAQSKVTYGTMTLS